MLVLIPTSPLYVYEYELSPQRILRSKEVKLNSLTLQKKFLLYSVILYATEGANRKSNINYSWISKLSATIHWKYLNIFASAWWGEIHIFPLSAPCCCCRVGCWPLNNLCYAACHAAVQNTHTEPSHTRPFLLSAKQIKIWWVIDRKNWTINVWKT